MTLTQIQATPALYDRGSAGALFRSVVVIGPPLEFVGGMSGVVRQTLGLSYHGQYRLHHLPTSHGHLGEGPIARFVRHARHVQRLRRFVRRLDASIVHIHTCSGFSFYRSMLDLAVARRLGCRTVLHIHGAAFDAFYARSSRVARTCISRGLCRADRVIALSASWRRKLLEMAPRAKVRVVENAVEIVARPAWDAGRLSAEPCHFVVLARMDTWKGIDDALSAAAILLQRGASFRLTLAGPKGSAGDRCGLEGKIEAAGLADRVRYAGPVVGEAKAKLLRAADVYLMPSHHEGMPLAVLEAMAAGLPIVGTRVGAVPEVVEDGRSGRLVAPGLPHDLADAMAAYIVDAPGRREAGRAAAEAVGKRFSIERLERDLTAVYDELFAAGGLLGKVVAGVDASRDAIRSPLTERPARALPIHSRR